MIEGLLVCLCIEASKRWRKAGKKGVGKYIAGVWVAVIVFSGMGGVASVAFQSDSAIHLFIAAGYAVGFIIAGFAMSAGKRLMEDRRMREMQEIQSADSWYIDEK